MEFEWIVGIITILLIFFLYYSSFFSPKRENFINFYSNVSFLSKEECRDVLINDQDNYYSTFTVYDLAARKVNHLDEYKDNIRKACSEFSDKEKKRLERLMGEADKNLRKIKKSWFDGERAADLQWRVGYTKGDGYEDGLPHTRYNVILLSEKTLKNDDNSLMGTLIHEKVHIYQKKYPEDVDKFCEEMKIRRLRRREVGDKIRANPDIDNYVYITGDGEEMKTVYKDNPSGLEDTETYPKNKQESEHPNEKMAIMIEEMII